MSASTAGISPEPIGPGEHFDTFREVFRRHAAGVAIITAYLDGKPYGFTATSLASLSATPPRFTFNMAQTSSSWPAIARAKFIGVHVLGLENQELADRFARTKDRFEGSHWLLGEHGVPVLKDVPGWLIGRIEARFPFDQNAVVVAQVVGGQISGYTTPLLYHSGQYSRPAPLEYEI